MNGLKKLTIFEVNLDDAVSKYEAFEPKIQRLNMNDV